MKGYVVIDTESIEPKLNTEYIEKSLPVIAAHGGRILARSSNIECVQGDWAPTRLVIMEFDSLEAAQGFVNSPEYVALGDLRRRAARSRIVVVEGSDSEA